MKNNFILFTFFLSTFFGFSQEKKEIDSAAVYIIERMSNIIGDLESVSFNLQKSEDVLDSNLNILKEYSTSMVTFSGPNKLLVRTFDHDQSQVQYDGRYVSYYNYNENNYVTLEAPGTTLEMIDQMHLDYDFKFPAADFFYPSFKDDVLMAFDSVKYVGKKMIDGEECYHIMANNENLNVQFWISNQTFLLPKRFVVIYKNKSNLQYECTFNNWQLNPNIPDSAFDFLPPPNSKLISILKKS